MTLMAVLGGLAALEMVAAGLVRWLRPGCKWIITPADEHPPIPADGLAKFLDHGWDPELGWVRKPGTSNQEVGADGRVVGFHIDGRGARRNPGFEDRAPQILVYGDSYAFCRQVNDDETWPHELSRRLGVNVANFGVGNYGLDQALLRLEREFDRHPAPLILMGVVPETIVRVMSVWKHFSEYGNSFAFKPRFVLDDGALRLIPNPADRPEKFQAIEAMLPRLKAEDFFYERKFSRDLLKFPFLWHLFQRRRRHFPLLMAALHDRLSGGGNERAFTVVMEQNIALAAELYREAEPLDLMSAIGRRFADFAHGKGTKPVLVLLPQLMDLKRILLGDHYYRSLVDRLKDRMTVVDLAPALLDSGAPSELYINDKYGSHLSAAGNALIADVLAGICRRLAAA